MAKGKRIAIEPNIYRYLDSGLLEARVRMGNLPPRVKPFQADSDLERARARAWVADQRKELTQEIRAFGDLPADSRRISGGTLDADVVVFLPQIKGRSCFKADRSHLRAWLAMVPPGETRPLGQFERPEITTGHINGIIALWQEKPSTRAIRKVRVGGFGRGTSTVKPHARSAPATSGSVVSARTIRHRCRLLAELYHTLDGKKAPTPVDEAKVPKVPKTHPVAIPEEVLLPCLAALRLLDLPTFCRYAVFCTTLQRPVQIGQADPRDVNLKTRTWLVRTAKNEPAHTIGLNNDAMIAWRSFAAAKCWGPFDTTKYGKLIHEAGLPAGYRPYQARHSGALAAIVAGLDLGKLQELLGHASPVTTRMYTPFVVDQQHKSAKAIDGRFKKALAGPRLVTKG